MLYIIDYYPERHQINLQKLQKGYSTKQNVNICKQQLEVIYK